MTKVYIAISEVKDGSMYTPSDQTNETIVKHRTDWLNRHGIALKDAVRVHISYDTSDFCRYRIITSENKGEGMGGPSRERVDALITTNKNVALFLPVADCVATTIFDEEHGVLMLSHLGRHSLEQQGGVKSVEFLQKHFQANPKKLQVWLSPAPSKKAYPIFKLDGKGMKEAVYEQLQAAGIDTKHIIDNAAETDTDDRYYSHSEFLKGTKTVDGRFAMVAMMQD